MPELQLQWPVNASTQLDYSESVSPIHPVSDEGWDVLDVFAHHPVIKHTIIATPTELIYDNAEDGNTQVFRAELRQVIDGCLTRDSHAAVCKVVYSMRRVDALKKEAQFYNNQLANLQGDCVPVMYGCFVGATREGVTGVLLMSDCGIPLPGNLARHTPEIRFQAVNALLKVHHAGLEHWDFTERNLVVSKRSDGGLVVRLIDFGNAQEHLGCPIKNETLEMYAPRPQSWCDFSCQELWCACEEADIWIKTYISWFTHRIPIDSITKVEDLVNLRKHPEGYDEESITRRAAIAIYELQHTVDLRMAWDEDSLTIEL
ncbi:hypothetical protein L227DRAFT_615316 [Lentinus tigrinus ALCF2SS1-6]|uniref:Uncharacterized protein n=1 Tax=Lentinus tigrinus ALCF2SS1-6 TaxID=1328759 RepID=A0A5C2RV31_9APHY|nr:hypothetical protein L227DRAFT_615316 [Lentinus tigrinus ALCF2SS1-6]